MDADEVRVLRRPARSAGEIRAPRAQHDKAEERKKVRV